MGLEQTTEQPRRESPPAGDRPEGIAWAPESTSPRAVTALGVQAHPLPLQLCPCTSLSDLKTDDYSISSAKKAFLMRE